MWDLSFGRPPKEAVVDGGHSGQRSIRLVGRGAISQKFSNRPCIKRVTASTWVETMAQARGVLVVECYNRDVQYLDGGEVYGQLLSARAESAEGPQTWKEIAVSAAVPPLCTEVVVGLLSEGYGQVRFDDVAAEAH